MDYLTEEMAPVVDRKIDHGWMPRTIARESGEGHAIRAAGEPRLLLAY